MCVRVPATMYDIRACIGQVAARNAHTLKKPSAVPSAGDQTSLYVGFLPVTTTQNALFQKFQHYGEIKRCHVTPPKHGMSYTYGFVQFKNPISAMTAARELHNTKWGEFSINVQWERPSLVTGKEKHGTAAKHDFGVQTAPYSVHVRHLPPSTTEEGLRILFSSCGTVENACVVAPSVGSKSVYGFVDFATLADAQTAVETMNDKTVSECNIKVELSHSTVSKRNQGNLPTETGHTLMERMKQIEQTTIDAEITQGSSQPPMVKRTRVNCRHTLKCQLAVDEAIISIFDRMTIPCIPTRIECSDDVDLLAGAVLKDSGYQSLATANGGSNSVSSDSTPVRKTVEHTEVMAEQGAHETARCNDRYPALATACLPKISLTNRLEEQGMKVELITTVRESMLDSQNSVSPPPLESSSFDSLYLPPSADLTPSANTPAMNEARSCTNEVGSVPSHLSHSAPTALRQDSTCLSRVSTACLGAGRGTMLFKLLKGDLRKPKPVVLVSQEKETPIKNTSPKHLGRGKMLSRVLEQLAKEPPPVGNIQSLKYPARNGLHTIPMRTNGVDEALRMKLPSVPKQACASAGKPRTVRIAAVFPGVDVKDQAGKVPVASVLAHRDQRQDGHHDLSEFKTNTKLPVDSEFLTLECSSSYSSIPQTSQNLERHCSSSPEYVPPEKQYQALSSGDELEFRENRQGRSSGDLERNIATHQRNIHRWQVELKRIQQKNIVLTEEVEREGNDVDLDLDGDVSVERVQEIHRVLELHAQLAAQTELLKRRDLDRELILMKGHQQYMNDKLAVMELRLSLEAVEIREKLVLAKLESRVLQMKSEFFL